jgi:1-acyl-sn-glycerol-3-phosphate acyltransferase
MSRITLDSSTGKEPRWIPRRGTLWPYFLTCITMHPVYSLSSRYRVEGTEHVPMESGAVVVCNHTPGHDYIPLGIAAPRQLYFMAKAEAFDFSPILRFAFENGGVFPVDRNKGDTHALEVAVEIVRSGKLLGMFPEGHRSPDGVLQRGKTGATRIALTAGVPVVPAAVIGAERAWHNLGRFWDRKYLVVRFGAPFMLEGKADDRAAIAAGTRRIMNEIAALLPVEMRGEWSGDPNEVAPARRSRAPRPEAPAAPLQQRVEEAEA